jgi:hypothetical protein
VSGLPVRLVNQEAVRPPPPPSTDCWRIQTRSKLPLIHQMLRSDLLTQLHTLGSSGRYQAAQEHLSCFVPSILGLGAKLLPGREKDLETAKLISQTCYYLVRCLPLRHIHRFRHSNAVAHSSLLLPFAARSIDLGSCPEDRYPTRTSRLLPRFGC